MAIVSMLYGAGGASSAEDVSYDNTTSGLEAENVQDAVDEVNDKVDEVSSNLKNVIDLVPKQTISVTSGWHYLGKSMTFTKGTWLILGMVNPLEPKGLNTWQLFESSSVQNWDTNIPLGAGDRQAQFTSANIRTFDSDINYYLWGYCDPTATTSTNFEIKGIKLG